MALAELPKNGKSLIMGSENIIEAGLSGDFVDEKPQILSDEKKEFQVNTRAIINEYKKGTPDNKNIEKEIQGIQSMLKQYEVKNLVILCTELSMFVKQYPDIFKDVKIIDAVENSAINSAVKVGSNKCPNTNNILEKILVVNQNSNNKEIN